MIDGAIKGLITGIVTVFVFALIFLIGKLAGGGAKKQPGETVLRYGGMFRGLALLCVLIVVIVLVVYVVGLIGGWAQEQGAAVGVAILVGLFGLIGIPLFLEGFRRQVILNDEGLTARGWFGTAPTVRWEEITSVVNKVMSGKYLVRTANAKIGLSHYLEGLDVFAEECKKRLAPAVYGDAFEKPVNRPFL